MVWLRKLLFPFSVLYGWVTAIRNFCYDKGIFRSFAFETPIIVVGNLSVGGTGKTPMVEYLVRLLSSDFKVAILSRGYKRKSEGFVLADESATVATLGDEAFQYHSKFPPVSVAVDVDRVNGITALLSLPKKPEVIILDDAFQHRRVQGKLNILLTKYGELYADDLILPAGNLRESRAGAKRAHIVIVTKCPEKLGLEEKNTIRKKLKLRERQQLFFTAIAYGPEVISIEGNLTVAEMKKREKVLVAGIAKPRPFFDFLKNGKDVVLEFPDHHDFSESDISQILENANGNPIVTTEKDFVRLNGKLPTNQLCYLPMATEFTGEGDQFDALVLEIARPDSCFSK